MTRIGSVILLELGIGVLDEDGKNVFSKKFNNPAHAYGLLKERKLPEEIEDITNEIKGYEKIKVNDGSLYSILTTSGLDVEMMPAEQEQEIKKNTASIAVKCGLSSDEASAIQQLREFAISLSSFRVKEASGKLDLHVIQSINALDELDKTINVPGRQDA